MVKSAQQMTPLLKLDRSDCVATDASVIMFLLVTLEDSMNTFINKRENLSNFL